MIILYVDDDPDDRDIFREAIRNIDPSIICHTAKNGLDALSFLDIQGPLPDVVFMDINMPLMNGPTCLAEIKANKRTEHLPVIIFTTSTNPTEVVECKKHGAKDFLNKPTSYINMVKILRPIIKSGNTFSPNELRH